MAALSVERASVGRLRGGFGGSLGGEALAEFAVGGDAAGDQDAARTEGFSGGEGLLHQVADHGVLEAGDEVQGLRIAGCERGFDSGAGGRVGAGKERIAASFSFGRRLWSST